MSPSTISRPRISTLVISGLLFAMSLVVVESAYGSCGSPTNPIEAENCLPGNPPSDWQIAGSGDPSIQGFATDISVNVGQTVGFKVMTDASNYVVDIYRLGYYGGTGARLVTTVSPSAQLPQLQPACMTDNVTFLFDCGNWALSASWQVPANATPGLYFAHLVRSDAGGDSHIYFVVRDDGSHSSILYQTSDLNWQAYNNYGGHSLYGASGFDIPNRARKVSYNRPFNTRNLEAATFIFNAEYPMIRWLEANGYDVSYFSGVDAARNASLILNHKVYLSSGHDEYWDGTQRANVQAARDAGVHLAFFSGNEMFWKTRWENSIDGTSTPNRTLVCYKETYGDSVDPLDPTVWTGTWRDPSKSPPADGGRPESALTGTLFKVNGPGADNTNLSMQVPAADGKMRFWRNTSLAGLAPNQVATLPPGTLGYEWDIEPDNLVRPAGLFHLSSATYNLTTDYLLDFGVTYGAGTATHHLSMYRAPSGALVFGAGSVQWAWGLDSNHDGSINPAPNPDMQQATVNLLADMGVQPATLQAGLQPATQSADAVPPVSTITAPAAGVTVKAGAGVSVTGTATDFGGGVVGGVEVSVDGGQTWHAAIGRENWTFFWTPSVVGTAALMSRAVDDSGNLENPQTSGGNPPGGVQVTVNPQVCPCSIWNPSAAPSLVDSGDGNSVELGVKFRSDSDGVITGLRFYKASTNTGTHVGHLWTSSGALLATATFAGESGSGWQQVQFATPVLVSPNTTYVASYFAPSGHYSADLGYFPSAGVDNPPVHALSDGVSGHNGVFFYTTAPGGFPSNSYNAANYWVDVVFVSGATFNIAGTLSGVGGAGATVNLTGNAGVGTTADSGGNYSFGGLVNGTYTVTPSNLGVLFTPAGQTVTVNGQSLNSVNFTAVVTSPLSISGTISGGPGTSVSLTGAASLTAATDAQGNYSFNGLISGSYLVTPSQAGYVFAPNDQSVTLTGVSISGVNFTAQACPCATIWPPTATPSLIDGGDGNSVNLGVKFRADADGYIVGLRFYKAALNTGTHIGTLWTNTGALLATATFTAESPTGWQQVLFSAPVAVSANTTYAASYLAPAGHYSADLNFFNANGVDSPPLHALANGVDGPNGVFLYSSTTAFPNQSFQSANYWVDVIYGAQTFRVAGTISGSGGASATVSLTGASTASTMADGAGNYSFSGLVNGSYTVTPSQAGYVFTPASQGVTVSGANGTANFASAGRTLSAISLSPVLVLGGVSSTGTVTLNGPAPAGGAVVTLSSSNAAVAQVLANVTVAANATTATFTVTTSPVAAKSSATISAAYGATKAVILTVNAAKLSNTKLSLTSVIGGSFSTGTVTLNGLAPAGGAVVTLSSSNAAVARVPANVTVAANATTATFTVTTSPVAAKNSATISAAYGATKAVILTVNAAKLSNTKLSLTSVIGGSFPTGTVTLNGPAPAGGAVVTLSSSNAAVAQVLANVTVAPDTTTATFTVTTNAVASNTSVTITGTLGASSHTATLTVKAPVVSSLTLSPTTVQGLSPSAGTVTLSGPAPAAGAVVTLSSNLTSIAKPPASVMVPAGSTNATFTVTTKTVTASTSVNIAATKGVTSRATLIVTP